MFFYLQIIGLTVRTLMRMQMNIQVKNPHNDRNLNPLEDKTVLPMVWVEMVIINNFYLLLFLKVFYSIFTRIRTRKWSDCIEFNFCVEHRPSIFWKFDPFYETQAILEYTSTRASSVNDLMNWWNWLTVSKKIFYFIGIRK